MTSPGKPLQRRRYRAPRQHATTLVDPPFSDSRDLIRDNRNLLAASTADLHGRSLAQLRELGRCELIADATRYTRAYRDVDSVVGDGPVLLAGHQPEFFHPGVWFKNFALDQMARRFEAIAVNLTIDSDTLKTPAVRVPTGSIEEARFQEIQFDKRTDDWPFEERALRDESTLQSFPARAAKAMRGLVDDPLLMSFWPRVVDRARATNNLGSAIAQSRHQLEGEWGLSTLEIPQSRVCDFESFRWFACDLLARLPEVWEIYNDAVRQYRQTHRIRSASHPVPNLSAADGWFEAPFWIWQEHAPRRRRLFARQDGGEIVLSNRDDLELRLPLNADQDASGAVAALAEARRRGIKIRTRALLTTLFARLVLGDLFLHGIGGAKYDELTDLLISRLFGCQPPGFMVLSATLHLPIRHEQVSEDDRRQVDHETRELEYHPERFLLQRAAQRSSLAGDVAEWIEEKSRWVETTPTRANARQRCHRIRELNVALARSADSERRELLRRREFLMDRLQSEAVLSWREYAFCLYPKQTLRDFLLEFRIQNP